MKRIYLLIAAGLISGCASDVANRYYANSPKAEVDVSHVELLWEKPKKNFVVIADFQSRGETPDDMRRKAAKIGADAVIVSIIGGVYNKGDQWAGKDTMAGSTNSGTGHIGGTAIVYK